MEIPFLKESIADSLRALVMSNLVLPTQISLPYTRIFGYSAPSKSNSGTIEENHSK